MGIVLSWCSRRGSICRLKREFSGRRKCWSVDLNFWSFLRGDIKVCFIAFYKFLVMGEFKRRGWSLLWKGLWNRHVYMIRTQEMVTEINRLAVQFKAEGDMRKIEQIQEISQEIMREF